MLFAPYLTVYHKSTNYTGCDKSEAETTCHPSSIALWWERQLQA